MLARGAVVGDVEPQVVDVVAAAVALERLGVRAAPVERLDQLEAEPGRERAEAARIANGSGSPSTSADMFEASFV